MSKLLSVDLRRAFMCKRFVIGALIPVLIASIIIYALKTHSGENYVDMLPYSIISFIPSIITIVGGLFISQDFNNNTVRNKIITGHSRTSIYISNLITSVLATVSIYLIYVVFCYGVGGLVVGFSPFFKLGFNLKCIGLSICPLITFSVLTVFLTMTLKGIKGTVCSFLLYYAFGMSTLLIYFIENKDISHLLANINPSLQLDAVQEYADSLGELAEGNSNFWPEWIPGTTIVATILSTFFGVTLFKKSDIK